MIKADLDEGIALAKAQGYTYTYADFLNHGAGNYYFDELYTETAYAIVVSYMDSLGNFTGEVAKAIGTTLAIVEPTGEEQNLGALICDDIEDYRDYDGSYILYFVDEDYDVELALNLFADEFTGTFDFGDIDEEYSYIAWYSTYTSLPLQDVALAATLNSSSLIDYAGSVTGYDGIKYNFTASDVNISELLGEESGLAARRISKKAAAPKKMAQRK